MLTSILYVRSLIDAYTLATTYCNSLSNTNFSTLLLLTAFSLFRANLWKFSTYLLQNISDSAIVYTPMYPEIEIWQNLVTYIRSLCTPFGFCHATVFATWRRSVVRAPFGSQNTTVYMSSIVVPYALNVFRLHNDFIDDEA